MTTKTNTRKLKIGDRVELVALNEETKARQLKKGDRGTVVFFQLDVPFVDWDRGHFNCEGKFVSALSGKWKYTDILAENVFRCQFCGGKVHRYEHLFQCEDCYSIADLNYGIMCESYSLIKINMLANHIRRNKLSLDDLTCIDIETVKVWLKITVKGLRRSLNDLSSKDFECDSVVID